MKTLIEAVHALSPNIRYVAVYNPTLLTLLTQRGDIDCGGMRFVLIRYGNFFEYVAPIAVGRERCE